MRKISLFLMISILVLTVGCSKTTSKNTEILTENITSIEPEKNNIYGVYESNASWAIDPTPENLKLNSYSIAKVKIESIEYAKFIDGLDYNRPMTPINVEVVSILSGEDIPKNTTIYTLGGDVTVSELIKHQSAEKTEKMGLNEISEVERESTYIKYTSEEDYNFEVGEEYVVILSRQENNICTVSATGYGIFKSKNNEKSNEETLVNVLTGENLNLE